MRIAWLLAVGVLGVMLGEGTASAQTMVEYGAGAGAAAGAAAGARGLGKSIGGAFDGVGKALKQAQDPAPDPEPPKAPPTSSKTATKPAKDGSKDSTAAAAPAVPLRPSYEDAMGIQKGMSCEEVERRFGPPAMAFTTEDNARTLSYASHAGGVQVECQGGKVATVDKPR